MSRRQIDGPPFWVSLFFSLAIALFVVHSPVSAQNSLARPSANLHGAYFLSPEEGWVVGQLGKVFHTTNGGKTWQEQNSRTNLLLTAVDFFDRSHGWAVGERGSIVHTEDGGQTWKPQESGLPYPLFDVDFIDKQKGWAVGHWGTILFTADGGQHWQERSLSAPLENRGPIEPAAFRDVIDPTSGEVLVKARELLSREHVAKIAERGITDVRVREDVVLNAVFFLDALHGWIVGEQGRVLRTSDGGQTWESITLPQPPNYGGDEGSEELMSDEELAAFGALTPPPSLYGVVFISPTQGWVVGQEGTIAQTQDGGRHWEFQSSGVKEALYDIGFADHAGWIVGDKGTILTSTNGGTQWQEYELGLEYRLSWLRRLSVASKEHSFLVGADGLVLASGKSAEQNLWIRTPNEK